LEGRYPYLFVDAKVEKVRDGGRVARKCVVVAHAVHESGRKEIIGLDVGEAETEAFWRDFLRSLVARGLVGVQLAISDAHPGLKNALAQVLGAPWQRCTVHYADSRVMPTRARTSCSGRERARIGRHNHSASRNARTRSVGW
jgi:transposase-like protein